MAEDEIPTAELIQIAQHAAKAARAFARLHEVAAWIVESEAQVREREQRVADLDRSIASRHEELTQVEADLSELMRRRAASRQAAKEVEIEAARRSAEAARVADAAVATSTACVAKAEAHSTWRLDELERAHAERLRALATDYLERRQALEGSIDQLASKRATMQSEVDALLARVAALGQG